MTHGEATAPTDPGQYLDPPDSDRGHATLMGEFEQDYAELSPRVRDLIAQADGIDVVATIAATACPMLVVSAAGTVFDTLSPVAEKPTMPSCGGSAARSRPPVHPW